MRNRNNMRWLTIALLTFTFTAQAEEVYRDNTVRFTLIDEGTIRLEYAPDGKFVDNKSFVAVIREYGDVPHKASTSGGKVVILHRSKKRISETEVIETERKVDNNLYEQMLQQADPYRQTIVKRRQSFIWKGQFFQIDTFLSPVIGLAIMETKGVGEQETINFPPFVKVLEDVTGNQTYYNYNLALRK